MEAEAREMSRLTANAVGMSCHAVVTAQRSRRATEAARRSRRAVDAADWSGRTAEAEEMSRRAAADWENVSRAGEDSYRRMHVIIHSHLDQISGWTRLQDDMKASFEQATGVI